MASLRSPEDPGIPNLIVIGVPDQAALNRVLIKLKSHQIPHYVWNEPDYDYGRTAIATAPLDDAQRAVLSNYRLWSCSYSPVVQCQNTQPLKLTDAG